jgi:hypothetical protein
MDRRSFLASSTGAALVAAAPDVATPATTPAAPRPAADARAGGGDETPASVRRSIFELRLYHLRVGPMDTRFGAYAKESLLPALNRAGVLPVGGFTVLFGPDSPTVYLLLPHPTADSVVTLGERLEADTEYRKSAAAFLALPAGDPPYVRVDSWLLTAFATVPKLEPPSGPNAVPGRVFELRSYESHSEAAGRKKVEMFEAGGEIAIFRRVGVTPVFFGRNVAGPRLPGLTYMSVFPDLAAREKAWAAFRDDPAWVKLRSTPGYTNAEIVSNTHVTMLRPADYSQI